jgi:hypothetical protein
MKPFKTKKKRMGPSLVNSVTSKRTQTRMTTPTFESYDDEDTEAVEVQESQEDSGLTVQQIKSIVCGVLSFLFVIADCFVLWLYCRKRREADSNKKE